MVLKNL